MKKDAHRRWCNEVSGKIIASIVKAAAKDNRDPSVADELIASIGAGLLDSLRLGTGNAVDFPILSDAVAAVINGRLAREEHNGAPAEGEAEQPLIYEVTGDRLVVSIGITRLAACLAFTENFENDHGPWLSVKSERSFAMAMAAWLTRESAEKEEPVGAAQMLIAAAMQLVYERDASLDWETYECRN